MGAGKRSIKGVEVPLPHLANVPESLLKNDPMNRYQIIR
jgi:hypothetical protein